MLPSTLLHFNHKHTKDAGIGYLEHIDTIEDTLRAFSLLLPGNFKLETWGPQVTELFF